MSENPFFKEFLAAAGLPPTPDLPEPDPVLYRFSPEWAAEPPGGTPGELAGETPTLHTRAKSGIEEGPGDLRQSDPYIKNLCAWLGPDTVLLPADGGDPPQPLIKDCSNITLAQSLSPEYQFQLRSSYNVGIITGTQGGRLCALRFNKLEEAEHFLMLNPQLRATLRTKSLDLIELWVRPIGWIPTSQNLGGWEWAGEGGWLEARTRPINRAHREIIHPAQPLEVTVLHLAWGQERQLTLQAQFCVYKHGPPDFLNAKGKRVLNYNFWAAYVAARAEICYHPQTKKFYTWERAQALWRHLESEQVQMLLAASLRGAANLHRACSYIHSYTTPARLKPFLAALRIIAADSALPVPDSLDHYLALRVERCAGQSLTSQELFADYRAACVTTSVSPLPGRAFKHQIRQAIERRFAIGRSNCIMREGSAHRGFLNLGFKTAAPKTGVDGSDATDALNPVTT